MPSHNLLLNFQDDLKIESSWKVNGTHYSKTSYAWLENMDKNKNEIISIFNDTYGKDNARMWFQRWRIFFLSCAVMFGLKMEQSGVYPTIDLQNNMEILIIFILHWYLSLFVQTFFLHRYASHQMFKMHPVTEKYFYFNMACTRIIFFTSCSLCINA